MSPKNRLRLILLAEILRSRTFLLCCVLAQTAFAVYAALNGWVMLMILALVLVAFDVKALAAANRPSRRSR